MPCSPGMTKCRLDCLHRAMVREYRETKTTHDEHRKIERELATHGFPTEDAGWAGENPGWGLRDFLISRRRSLAHWQQEAA
jgi:hypothetical protein